MKILLVNDFLHPQTHGIAVRFEHYIKHIKEKNHSIKVYGPSNCPTADKHLLSIINCFNPLHKHFIILLKESYTMRTILNIIQVKG
jgi:hypothetical protein